MFIVLLLVLLLAGFVSYFITARLCRQLKKKHVSELHVAIAAVLTFATSFILIMFVIIWLYFMAVPFER